LQNTILRKIIFGKIVPAGCGKIPKNLGISDLMVHFQEIVINACAGRKYAAMLIFDLFCRHVSGKKAIAR
jgi:hypothetical protein